MARQEDIDSLTGSWRQLKENTFGLDPTVELKYNIPEDHPSRAALDTNGWFQQRRIPAMLSTITQMPIIAVADTIVDMRGQRNAMDYLVDGIAWCVRRLANHVDWCLGRPLGPHSVIIDYPPAPASFDGRLVSSHVRAMFEQLGTAPFARYQERFNRPERYGSTTAPPYRDLDFAPGLLASHAKHSDLLQVADVIAGATRDFCQYNLRGADDEGVLPDPDYQDANFRTLVPIMHRGGGRCATFGFAVFPPRHPAAPTLEAYVDEMCAALGSPNHPLCQATSQASRA